MATPKPGWKMPESPVEGAVASYYNDGNEIWLGWEDPQTGEPATRDDSSTIAWPFVEEQALHSDLEALGFINSDA